MRRFTLYGLFFALLGVLLTGMVSCNTMRYVPQDRYLLHRNVVEVENETDLKRQTTRRERISPGDLMPYVQQRPNNRLLGMGIYLGMYNLTDTAKHNGWQRFWREKVGVYANAGYPNYEDKDKDGFPDDFAPSKRLAVFFGAHPDYYETYRSFPDATFNPAVQNEKGQYVANAQYKDAPSAHFVEGNLPRSESQGVHTVDDLVVTARGPNADQIRGFMNSTEIFRVMAEALALGR